MLPDAGDVAWIELGDTLGTEQAGRRPALILTDRGYNQRTGRALICPITKREKPWTFHVPIPAGLDVEGAVMVDQVRVVSIPHRVFDHICVLPPTIVTQVRGLLAALAGIAVA